MRLVRAHFLVSLSAFVCAFALTMGTAFAGGTITYAKKEIQENSGQWHLMMTIIYGGKPVTAHVPMRFTFVPTAILENFLDDAHGDKPQKRKIPLVGQTPKQESVDVDFSDNRGKMYDRTRFDFNITRSHDFVAGDYSVTVHRPDGQTIGTTQTLVLLGDNPVIDRRTISFVGTKKEKPPAAAAAADAPAAGDAKTASAPAAGNQPAAAAAGADTPASPAETPPEDTPDPAAPAKVPPPRTAAGVESPGPKPPVVRRLFSRSALREQRFGGHDAVDFMTDHEASRQKKRDPRAEMLRALNDAKQPGAKIEHQGSFFLGPTISVQKYRLGNGLTVLLSVDSSAPVASYHTWFSVGSRHEKVGKTGLAHLFEHLMFNETKKHKAGAFNRKLEEAGAESNAATWVDWTFYHESIPKDRIGLVIDLEAERMSQLVLREPQVTSEKEVVANERRYRVDDDVEGAVSELLYNTAYTTHAYRWPTIGWMADIEGFTTDDCAGFYRTYYAPNNATTVIVGDIREKDVLAKIQNAYGGLESAEIPVEDILPEPPQLEERRVSIKKPTATDKLAIAYHGPAFGDVDHVPLAMLTEVLFSGRSSRCHRALIQEQELCTELRGWVGTFKDPGLFEIYATARPGKSCADILESLDRELARVVEGPITSAELEKVKAKVELGLVQSLETASGKAEQIGFYHTVLGDPVGAFSRLEAYRRTTRSDLLRVARRYLVKERRTIVEVHPESAKEPG